MAHARPPPAAGGGTAVVSTRPLTFSFAKRITLTRDELARHATHARLGELTKGCFVRMLAGKAMDGSPVYRLYTVDGRAPDEAAAYPIALPASRGQPARTVMTQARLWGVYRGRRTPFRLNLVSNSPPFEAEYTRMVGAAQQAGMRLLTKLEAVRRAQKYKRDVAEMHHEYSVGSEAWGAPGTHHYASVLFRSWQAYPTPRGGMDSRTAPTTTTGGTGGGATAGASGAGAGAGSGAGTSVDSGAGSGAGGSATPAAAAAAAGLAAKEAAEFAAALERPGESSGDRGPDGVKYRGGFCYLLQHRSPDTWKGMANKGQNQLGFPGGQADPEDHRQPDVTAWREAVEELCQGLSQAAFLSAVIRRIDDIDDGHGRPGATGERPTKRARTDEAGGSVAGAGAGAGAGEGSSARPLTNEDNGADAPLSDERRPPVNLKSSHQIIVVDADKLVATGALPAGWIGDGRKAKTAHELCFDAFPKAHCWVPESVLLAAAGSDDGTGVMHAGVEVWPLVAKSLGRHASKLVPRRRGNVRMGYHGTKVDAAKAIAKTGFLRPKCRKLTRCARGDCQCQMLGFGVYFAEYEKAAQFARRRAVWVEEEGKSLGAVLHCEIDLGYCKRALKEPCPCGCGKNYVDHKGSWYSRDGYDSLFVANHSMPATDVAEWCVADPDRIKVVKVEYVWDAEDHAEKL